MKCVLYIGEDETLHTSNGSPVVFDNEATAVAYAESNQHDDYYTKALIAGHDIVIELELEESAVSLHDYWVANGVEHDCPGKCGRYQ